MSELNAVWIICSDGYYPYCSNCGFEPKWNGGDNRTPKCPNCGARMKNETDPSIGEEVAKRG